MSAGGLGFRKLARSGCLQLVGGVEAIETQSGKEGGNGGRACESLIREYRGYVEPREIEDPPTSVTMSPRRNQVRLRER